MFLQATASEKDAVGQVGFRKGWLCCLRFPQSQKHFFAERGPHFPCCVSIYFLATIRANPDSSSVRFDPYFASIRLSLFVLLFMLFEDNLIFLPRFLHHSTSFVRSL